MVASDISQLLGFAAQLIFCDTPELNVDLHRKQLFMGQERSLIRLNLVPIFRSGLLLVFLLCFLEVFVDFFSSSLKHDIFKTTYLKKIRTFPFNSLILVFIDDGNLYLGGLEEYSLSIHI